MLCSAAGSYSVGQGAHFQQPAATFFLQLHCTNTVSELYILGQILFGPKGRLISKCLFEKLVWTKIPTKNLIDSAQQV